MDEFDHYLGAERLPNGRFGPEYKVEDLKFNRYAILKLAADEYLTLPDFSAVLQQEAGYVAALQHAHIVKLLDFSSQEGPRYLVYDYVADGTLAERLEETTGGLPAAEVVRLGWQLASALAHAHKSAVFHGNLTPNNILIHARDEEPADAFINNFGIPAILHRVTVNELQPFQSNPTYADPALSSDAGPTAQGDLYALGRILWEMATGNVAAPELPPELPEGLTAVLQRANRVGENGRFATAAELAQALQDVAAELNVELGSNQGGGSITASGSASQADPNASEQGGNEPTEPIPDNADRLLIYRRNPELGLHGQELMIYGLLREQQLVTLGSGRNNDIVLTHRSVSRHHLHLERADYGWRVHHVSDEGVTYMGDEPILPDRGEAWSGRKSLRVGIYHLELELQADKTAVSENTLVDIDIVPERVVVGANGRSQILIALTNNSDERRYYQVKLDELADAWYTIPQSGVPLEPRTQVGLRVDLHLPAGVKTGTYDYKVIVDPLSPGEPNIIKRAKLFIEPQEAFAVALQPSTVFDDGVCELIVQNQGNVETTFTLRGDGAQLLFAPAAATIPQTLEAVWAQEGEANAETAPAAMPSTSHSRFSIWLRNLPLLRTIFRSWQQRRHFHVVHEAQSHSRYTTPALKKPPFVNELRQTFAIPPRQQKVVSFGIRPQRKRLRQPQELPFTIQVGHETAQPKTLTGQVQVRPQVSDGFIASLTLLLLFACLAASLVMSTELTAEQELAAMVATAAVNNATLHSDEDGLSDFQELAGGSNPYLEDTDGDGLNDYEECTKPPQSSPLKIDTDQDGIPDSLDRETLPDGMMHYGCAALPNNYNPPRINESGISQIPDVQPQLLLAPPQFDGYLHQKTPDEVTLVATDAFIVAGDDAENTPYFGFVSFDLSHVSSHAVIHSADLLLFLAEETGEPLSLGHLQVEMAVTNELGDAITLREIEAVGDTVWTAVSSLRRGHGDADWIASLTETKVESLRQGGMVQFRLYFEQASNKNGQADQMRFFAGEAASRTVRPHLILNITPSDGDPDAPLTQQIGPQQSS